MRRTAPYCVFKKEDEKGNPVWEIDEKGKALEKNITAVAEKIGKEKVYKDGIRRYGNTSAATCAIGLDEVLKEGLVEKGDLVVLTAFGAGPVTCANAIKL